MTAVVPSVDVIVVSYADGEAVARCVESVLGSTYAALRVIVVDNASGDGTAGVLARRFPTCRVVETERNLGFGAGCNVGIEISLRDGTDFALILNQDTVVEPTVVGVLVEFLREHGDVGVVGPKTLSTTHAADGRPRRLYAGAWRGRLPLIQDIPGIEQPDAALPDSPFPTDYVWGHGMMLRVAAIAEVGSFDPDFFLYCEDLDLCLRLRRAGYGVWCEPRAVMWHDIPDGARADHSEYWRWLCKVRSIRIFHRKHVGGPAAAVLSLATVLVEAKRLVVRRRFRAARHLLGAYAESLARSDGAGTGRARESSRGGP